MADVYEIKNRIDGLKSIHNITYAMQIVTISRLKKITTQLQKLKDSLTVVKKNLDYLVEEHPKFRAAFNPQVDHEKAPALVLFFSNRGFCGSFNQDILNYASQVCQKKEIDFNASPKIGVGKKAKLILGDRFENTTFFEPQKDLISKEEGVELFNLLDGFIKENRKILFVYFEFKSIVSQKIVMDTFYPPSPEEMTAGESEWGAPKYLEPSVEDVQLKMIEHYYYLRMFQTIRDSASSEFSQRFLLMKNAVDNVKSLSEEFSLELNKERQRGITQEISEIISTFKALQKK
jgi:F-type H+-transporting ATPase subunit gamma